MPRPAPTLLLLRAALGVLLLAAALALGASSASAQDDGPLQSRALLEALRGGGYNLYFRHAATDWSGSDRVRGPGSWTSCEPDEMRQLSEAGREQAAAIGRALRALEIPVGRVVASEYCRTLETARAMALGPPVEATQSVLNARVADRIGGREALRHTARRQLGMPPAPGTNTVLVAHGNVLRLAADTYADEGGAVIFRPQGHGEFEIVASIAREDWAALREVAGGEE